MEAAGELHGLHEPLSLYKPHIRKAPSMGILRAPPPSFPHSHRQPPLLPLPATHLSRSSSAFSHPAANKSRNTPKKSKSPSKAPKKEEKKISRRSSDSTLTVISSSSGLGSMGVAKDDVVKGCNNWMTIFSPPPSSLPLPTFTLRRKVGCNGGVEAGASDDLRRLLRLQ